MSNYFRVEEIRLNLSCGREYKKRLWACKELFRSYSKPGFLKAQKPPFYGRKKTQEAQK
jgi:hypothetical protein